MLFSFRVKADWLLSEVHYIELEFSIIKKEDFVNVSEGNAIQEYDGDFSGIVGEAAVLLATGGERPASFVLGDKDITIIPVQTTYRNTNEEVLSLRLAPFADAPRLGGMGKGQEFPVSGIAESGCLATPVAENITWYVEAPVADIEAVGKKAGK